MRGIANSARMRGVTWLSGGALAAVAIAGCGSGSHFKDAPRPPVPVELTGVITAKSITVSPNNIGAGPIHLLISNQTQQAQTVVLERSGNQGEPNRDSALINPLQAAALQQDLTEGQYTVSVSNPDASIAPATIVVTHQRRSSSGTLQLP